MNNQIFFIQTDGNNHVSTITHDNHLNDNNWHEVIVDPEHLSAFQQHYNEVMYDPNAQALVYPEGFAADAAITNDNKGIIQNLQDQINSNKNNISSNEKLSLEAAPSLLNKGEVKYTGDWSGLDHSLGTLTFKANNLYRLSMFVCADSTPIFMGSGANIGDGLGHFTNKDHQKGYYQPNTWEILYFKPNKDVTTDVDIRADGNKYRHAQFIKVSLLS